MWTVPTWFLPHCCLETWGQRGNSKQGAYVLWRVMSNHILYLWSGRLWLLLLLGNWSRLTCYLLSWKNLILFTVFEMVYFELNTEHKILYENCMSFWCFFQGQISETFCLFLTKCVIIKHLYVGPSWVQQLDWLGIVSKKDEFLNCCYKYTVEWIKHYFINDC